MRIGMTDRSSGQGRTEHGIFQRAAPIIPFRAIRTIRGRPDSKHATQDESEKKRTSDSENGHGQHFRYLRERFWSSMLV
jgi:hypothetical protein